MRTEEKIRSPVQEHYKYLVCINPLDCLQKGYLSYDSEVIWLYRKPLF